MAYILMACIVMAHKGRDSRRPARSRTSRTEDPWPHTSAKNIINRETDFGLGFVFSVTGTRGSGQQSWVILEVTGRGVD